jgi:hypothetical protein
MQPESWPAAHKVYGMMQRLGATTVRILVPDLGRHAAFVSDRLGCPAVCACFVGPRAAGL